MVADSSFCRGFVSYPPSVKSGSCNAHVLFVVGCVGNQINNILGCHVDSFRSIVFIRMILVDMWVTRTQDLMTRLS